MSGESWSDTEILRLAEGWLAGHKGETLVSFLSHVTGFRRSENAILVKAAKLGLPQRDPKTGLVELPLADQLDRATGEITVQPRARMRRCSCCGEWFWSTHAGHRRCDPCRGDEVYQSAGRFAVADGSRSSRQRGVE